MYLLTKHTSQISNMTNKGYQSPSTPARIDLEAAVGEVVEVYAESVAYLLAAWLM
jgi:hypothetical protein